jgi:EmrB/QacA subfamily drug resistance transporter
MTDSQRKVAGLAMLVTIILAILDSNIVTSAAVPIVRSLDPAHGVARLPWLITAYGLGATAALPLYGKLCDVYGAKLIFLGAVATFLAGSALCGLAGDMIELILFRALQGVGGGGLMSVTMVVMAQLAPPEERARKGGIGGIVAGLGLVVGPLVGGLLTDHLGWRWIFFVNLPLGLAVLVVAATVLHLPRHHERRRIDYPGAMLAAGFAVTLSLLLEWGGDRYAWTSATIVGLGVLALLLLAGFLAREATAAEPVLPLRLFANPAIRLALPLQGLIGIAMTGAIVYVMIYLQVVRGVSAEHAGYYLIPMAVGLTAAGMVVGRLVSRGAATTTFMITGTGLGALALGLLGLLRVHSGTGLLATALLVYGLGLGQVIGLLVMVVQNAAPPHQLGVATTALRLFQTLGGALGAAVFGAVFGAGRAPGGAAALASLPAGERAAALAGVVHALDIVFLSAGSVMALAMVLAVVLRARRVPAEVRPELVTA